MWQADREMQRACFRNVEISRSFNWDGHGRNSVTPEQVCLQKNGKRFSQNRKIVSIEFPRNRCVRSRSHVCFDLTLFLGNAEFS